MECRNLGAAGFKYHTLVINPIIYAECSVGYNRIEEVEALFEHLGFAMKPIPKEALFLAGKAFLQ